MWCLLVAGLVSLIGGISMVRTGEGPDLRHKRIGQVSGEKAVNQGKGAIAFGVILIIVSIIMIVAIK